VTRQPERYRSLQYQTPPTHTSSSPRRRSAAPSRRTSAHDQGHESDTPGDIATARQHSEKGWKKGLQYFQSIELENKGSVARDHLALGTPSSNRLVVNKY